MENNFRSNFFFDYLELNKPENDIHNDSLIITSKKVITLKSFTFKLRLKATSENLNCLRLFSEVTYFRRDPLFEVFVTHIEANYLFCCSTNGSSILIFKCDDVE